MRRWLLLLAALLAGCDDESIPARVAAAQLHGITAGAARCDGTLTRTTSPFDTVSVEQNFFRFADGSGLTTGPNGVAFCARSEACAEKIENSPHYIGDGVVTRDQGPGSVWTAPVETICTGFGFEAFGVSP